MKRSLISALIGIWCLCLLPAESRAQAQPARDGKLVVTVVDPTQAIVPNATVTIVGLENATRTAAAVQASSNDRGLATFENLALGRYAIRAQFPGFEVGLIADVRVRAGENKHVVVLPLKRLEDSVTVSRDKQEAAADRSLSFGTALTREQLEALSEDPDEMRRQLMDMAGPDAVIRVDSFEGQQLPPKAQIKSVRITRDQFAAENHFAGGLSIEIVTQPGIGPLRASVRMNGWDSSMDGKNPLIGQKGPSRSRNFGGSLGGTLIKNRSTFSISMNDSNSYNTPVIYATTTAGRIAQNCDCRQPFIGRNISGLLDYALTKDQTLRIGFGRNSNRQENSGVGGFNNPERGFTTEIAGYSIRAQEIGPLGRRFFTNTRVSLGWTDTAQKSVVEAATYIIQDANSSGGAQQAGGTHARNVSIMSDLDYVRGRNSVRMGVQIDGSRFRTDARSNYLGTYTFESLQAFEEGRPRSYTRRIGDPNIAYWNVQAGLYIQDDIKLRKNLSITPGIRYEAQVHMSDWENFGPRMGFTWAPFKNGKTTVRSSAGIFYEWLGTGIYSQTLQVDGFRQRELNIINPSFPDPGSVGPTPATNRYLLGDNLQMIRYNRLSAGISQTIKSRLNVGATYQYSRGRNLLVGTNLNAPLNGVRPDPTFANIVETNSYGRSRDHLLSTNASLSFFAPSAPNGSPKFFDWKRNLGIYGSYNFRNMRNNTDGAFTIPALTDLGAEWGPGAEDIHNRGSLSLNSSMIRNLSMSWSFSATGARPLTIRTGQDDNGDLVFNDRPAGVGRNSKRIGEVWSSYAYVSYSISFGKRAIPAQPGIMITSMGGGAPVVQMMTPQAQPRYRLNFGVDIQNPTNHATYSGYSGVITSPYYLKPTSSNGFRRINFNVSLSF